MWSQIAIVKNMVFWATNTISVSRGHRICKYPETLVYSKKIIKTNIVVPEKLINFQYTMLITIQKILSTEIN